MGQTTKNNAWRRSNTYILKYIEIECSTSQKLSNWLTAAIAEHVIRTIKERLLKYFSSNGSYKWIDVLPEIIKNYNNRKHRTIKMRLSDVNKNNEANILKLIYNHLKIGRPRKIQGEWYSTCQLRKTRLWQRIYIKLDHRVI